MKHLFLCITLLTFVSCSSNKYEKLATERLQTIKGTIYDLDLKYSQFHLSDITVQDSINILNQIYETERQKNINLYQGYVNTNEKSIKRHNAMIEKDPNDAVSKIMLSKCEKELVKNKALLEEANIWKPAYLNEYGSRNPKKVLAKKADVKFSYMNPILKTRAEESGVIIMNIEGTEVLSLIKK